MYVHNGKPHRVHRFNDNFKSFAVPVAISLAIAATVVLELTEPINRTTN